MKFITLPDQTERRLSFYLAMEEYVARHFNEPDAFFLWQVAPTVIFGRNQVAGNEVNLDYCRQHAISVYRRKSGGGCVYADNDNLMWSFVMRTEHVGLAFNRFVNMVLLVLRKMGIEAVGTSHNDILVEGRKVCGTACYHLDGRCIVHKLCAHLPPPPLTASSISKWPPKAFAKLRGTSGLPVSLIFRNLF